MPALAVAVPAHLAGAARHLLASRDDSGGGDGGQPSNSTAEAGVGGVGEKDGDGVLGEYQTSSSMSLAAIGVIVLILVGFVGCCAGGCILWRRRQAKHRELAAQEQQFQLQQISENGDGYGPPQGAPDGEYPPQQQQGGYPPQYPQQGGDRNQQECENSDDDEYDQQQQYPQQQYPQQQYPQQQYPQQQYPQQQYPQQQYPQQQYPPQAHDKGRY